MIVTNMGETRKGEVLVDDGSPFKFDTSGDIENALGHVHFSCSGNWVACF